jgi:hypothetical protein
MAVVAFSARQKRTLGRELRDFVFRLSTTAGMLLGAFWAFHHQYVAPQHPCPGIHARGSAVARAAGRCISSDLSAAIKAWVIPIVVGALVGMLLGVVLAQMIRLGRTPRVG